MVQLNFFAVLQGQYLRWLLAGAAKTMLLFSGAWIAGFLLALVIVALRTTQVRALQLACAVFVGYHRNVPGLVQILVWYFGVPQILPEVAQNWMNAMGAEFGFALIALSLNAAAYMSEDLRSGIRALPVGQTEAARALGLSFVQTMRRVILPQAVRIAVPPLVNQSLSLFKSTTLAMAIGVSELTYATRQIENETFRTFEVFALASAFYLIVSFAVMGMGSWYDARRSRMGAG